MSVNPGEVQQGFDDASLQATATSGAVLFHNSDATVRLLPGAQLSAWVDNDCLYFEARPGLLVSTVGPDVAVTSVRYDFATAKFVVGADAVAPVDLGIVKFDAMGLWTGFVVDKLEGALDKTLRPLLPPKMAHPGYTVHGDKDMQGTLAQLRATIGNVSHKGAHHGGKDAGVKDLAATATVEVQHDMVIPLAKGVAGTLKAGTRLTLTGTTSGAPPHALLTELQIDIDEPGFEVAPTGEGLAHDIATLDLRRMTITRGGHFAFDYALGPEQLADGMLLIGALVGAASGNGTREDQIGMPDVHIDAVRQRVDALLQSKVPPPVEKFLDAHDGVIPGVSIASLFGATRKA